MTIVVDLKLARRLERAEALANAEFVDARCLAFPESKTRWIELAGTLAMYDGQDSPCTQTFCLGMFEAVTATQLDQIEQFFHERGAPVFHEVCPLSGAPLARMLCERSYQPVDFTNVLYRPLSIDADNSGAGADGVCARLAEPGEEALWARTAAEGWSDVAPQYYDYIIELQHLNPHRHSSRCFLAEKAGQAIASGAVGLYEGVAQFAGASTIPRWRNQGAQRALLEARLRYAASQGCDLAMMVAEPGSASQRNAERQGFRIAFTRTKWGKPFQPG
jgi:GNAT superfamily N-acetyltransferase